MPTFKQRVLDNFVQRIRQYQPDETPMVRLFAKVDPDYIYDLLNGTRPFARERAKELLMQMATKRWRITAAPYEGGKNPDAELHISVQVMSRPPWHIYCKELAAKMLYISTSRRRCQSMGTASR